MVGQRRGLRTRTALSALGLWALVCVACGQATEGAGQGLAGAGTGAAPGAGAPSGTASGGRGNTGGIPGSGGSHVGLGGGGSVPPPTAGGAATDECAEPAPGAETFEVQAVEDAAPAVRELFTWTTPEQIAELRAGAPLLNRTEREGMGPGYAFVALREFSETSADVQQQRLANLLLTAPFAEARFAWPNPWATRMGWPGESYGGELVRLLLRSEAYLVLFDERAISVVDMQNREVSLATALATPERIAGIYFVRRITNEGLPFCGTFQHGDVGYREFIVANERMIAEWSLATETMRARLEEDIRLLETFRDRIEECALSVSDLHDWQQWAFCGFFSGTVWDDYHRALAFPSEHYFPDPERLAAIVSTLRGDLFTPDPFVVMPER